MIADISLRNNADGSLQARTYSLKTADDRDRGGRDHPYLADLRCLTECATPSTTLVINMED
jgi:hypothetical protein